MGSKESLRQDSQKTIPSLETKIQWRKGYLPKIRRWKNVDEQKKESLTRDCQKIIRSLEAKLNSCQQILRGFAPNPKVAKAAPNPKVVKAAPKPQAKPPPKAAAKVAAKPDESSKVNTGTPRSGMAATHEGINTSKNPTPSWSERINDGIRQCLDNWKLVAMILVAGLVTGFLVTYFLFKQRIAERVSVA